MQGAGINPARIQSVLRQASDQQLMMMLRRPDKIPSMFVQQELQRRRAMRQNAKAEQTKMQAPIQRPQQNMNNVSPQNFGRDMNMARQPIGLKHGGQHPTPQEIFNKQSAIDSTIGATKAYLPYTGLAGSTPYQARGLITATDMKLRSGQSDKDLYEDYYNYLEGKDAGIKNLETPMTNLAVKPVGFTGQTTSAGAQIPFDITDYIKRDPSVAKDDLDPEDLGQVSASYIPGTDEYKKRIDEERKRSGLDTDLKGQKESYPNPNDVFNIDDYLKKQMQSGKKDINLPDQTSMKTTLTNLENTLTANNKAAKDQIDANIKRDSGISKIRGAEYDKYKTTLEKIKKEKSALFDTKEMEKLYDGRKEVLNEALNYIENDKTIINSQQKLLDAMKPQMTPAQRFFGYVAQIGADIAGSDKDTFLEAGGSALSQAMKDYKFDNEKERERFVNNAKLMLEFEYQKQQNKMNVYKMKADIFGQDMEFHEKKTNMKLNEIQSREASESGIFTLNKEKNAMFDRFNDKANKGVLDKLNLDSSYAKDMFSIVSTKSQMEQDQFANALELASDDRARIDTMVKFLTPEAKNFRILQNLPPDQQASFLSLFKKNSDKGATPDVTARGILLDLTTRIGKAKTDATTSDFSDVDAAKQVLGDALYAQVKNVDGSIDTMKLYSVLFSNVYQIQTTGGMGTAGTASTSYQDYLAQFPASK